LPVGLAALAVVASVLPASIGRSERGTRVDVRGIALLTLSVGLVLVGLNLRSHARVDGTLPGWLEPGTGGLIAAGVAVLAAFVVAERRAEVPVVPLGLLTDRRTGALLLAAATGAFGLFAGVLLLPLYFQNVRHVSATHSGLLIYPLLVGLVVSVNVGGMAIGRSGEFRRVILATTGLLAVGGLGFATFDAATPGWESSLFMLLMGAGVGPLLSGSQIALQRMVPPRAIGAAMGALMLLRQVGASLALTLAASLYVSARQGGASAAAATGDAVSIVALAGVMIAVGALLSLPRGARQFAVATVPAAPIGSAGSQSASRTSSDAGLPQQRRPRRSLARRTALLDTCQPLGHKRCGVEESASSPVERLL
jgi:hypothetical protein